MKSLALALTIILSTFGVALGSNTDPGPELPKWVTRACVMEDDVNCYWNAKEMGNGEGHSFIVRKVPGRKGMVCVFYAERKYAKTHDYCS